MERRQPSGVHGQRHREAEERRSGLARAAIVLAGLLLMTAIGLSGGMVAGWTGFRTYDERYTVFSGVAWFGYAFVFVAALGLGVAAWWRGAKRGRRDERLAGQIVVGVVVLQFAVLGFVEEEFVPR